MLKLIEQEDEMSLGPQESFGSRLTNPGTPYNHISYCVRLKVLLRLHPTFFSRIQYHMQLKAPRYNSPRASGGPGPQRDCTRSKSTPDWGVLGVSVTNAPDLWAK